MKKRVLMFLPRYLPILGGAEVQCSRLCKELSDSYGDKISIYGVCTRRLTHKLKARDKIDNIDIWRLPPSGLGVMSEYVFVMFFMLFCIAKRKKFDVIHCHASSIFGLGASIISWILRKRCIIKISTNGELFSSQRGKIKPILIRWMLRHSHIVALNNEGADEAINIENRAKLHIIPNGIGVIDELLWSEDSLKIKQEILKYHNKKIGVFVGRLVNRKGIDLIIDLAKLLEERKIPITIAIVGGGELQRDGINIPECPENMVFLGEKTNVTPYLLAADFFVSPSRREGLPNTVLEALSVGLPCILSDIKPHKELKKDHDEHIRIFEKDNLSDFFRVLNESVNDMSFVGRRKNRLNNLYEINKVAGEYSNLYLS